MSQSGGNAHGALKGISREEYEKLKATGIPDDMADNMICADRILESSSETARGVLVLSGR